MSTLSIGQESAVTHILNGENVFISGNAGSGKTFLLRYLKTVVPNLHITASTGIAAVHVGGQTIHSWCGIGTGTLPADKILFCRKVVSRVKYAKILAIDEISMISADTFELISDTLKLLRKNDAPFGGIQLILFGDFFQLPPVSGNFCFTSPVWAELALTNVILRKSFRQVDETFINLLNCMRSSELDQEHINLLTERTGVKCTDEISPIKLVSHNAQADKINKLELEKIQNLPKVFTAKYKGSDQTKVSFLKKNCLAHEVLVLKVGAHVMMLRNTYSEQGIINGSTGVVTDFDPWPVVKFENGIELQITPEKWTSERYDDSLAKVVCDASMEQIPLILAWAITIHKSQGMTLSKIRCDLSKVFVHGQSYVALSRVKSLEGLYIDDIDFNKISVSESVVKFYEEIV